MFKRLRKGLFFTSFFDELRAMKPGQVEIITCQNGDQFAVLHVADFEYIAEQAGMNMVDLKKSETS